MDDDDDEPAVLLSKLKKERKKKKFKKKRCAVIIYLLTLGGIQLTSPKQETPLPKNISRCLIDYISDSSRLE